MVQSLPGDQSIRDRRFAVSRELSEAFVDLVWRDDQDALQTLVDENFSELNEAWDTGPGGPDVGGPFFPGKWVLEAVADHASARRAAALRGGAPPTPREIKAWRASWEAECDDWEEPGWGIRELTDSHGRNAFYATIVSGGSWTMVSGTDVGSFRTYDEAYAALEEVGVPGPAIY